jgi:cell division protein FtsB
MGNTITTTYRRVVDLDEDMVTIEVLTTENASLRADNERLTTENARLRADNEKLTADVARLTADVARLTADNERLTAENASLRADNEKLTARIAALEALVAPVARESLATITCPICMDTLDTGDGAICRTPCMHLYHTTCIRRMFLIIPRRKCALCRTPIANAFHTRITPSCPADGASCTPVAGCGSPDEHQSGE